MNIYLLLHIQFCESDIACQTYVSNPEKSAKADLDGFSGD